MSRFIQEMIKGRHADRSEDRLSRVFSALFNGSAVFRLAVRRALSINGESGFLVSVVQPPAGARQRHGRLDLKIVDQSRQGREAVVIENKIDSRLTGKQLLKYKKAASSNRRVVALVRRPPRPKWGLRRFEIYSWSQVGAAVVSVLGRCRSQIEKALLVSFVTYLEEMKMKPVPEVTRSDLSSLQGLNRVFRSDSKWELINLGRKSPFEVAASLTAVFAYVCEEARRDDFFEKRFEKRFRFAPWFQNWRSNDDEGYPDRAIGFSISNQWRGRSKKIASVGLLYLVGQSNRKSGFFAFRRSKNQKGFSPLWVENKISKAIVGEKLHHEVLKREVLKRWKRWLS